MSNTLFAHSLLNRNRSASFFFLGFILSILGRTLGFTPLGVVENLRNWLKTVQHQPKRIAAELPLPSKKEKGKKKKKEKTILWVMLHSCQPTAEVPYQGGVYPEVEMDQTSLCRSFTVQQKKSLSIPTTASCWTGTVKVVG